MWPFKTYLAPEPLPPLVVPPPHPLYLRIYEIGAEIEKGFWGGKGVGAAFDVVSKHLAEQEDRIKNLEQKVNNER